MYKSSRCISMCGFFKYWMLPVPTKPVLSLACAVTAASSRTGKAVRFMVFPLPKTEERPSEMFSDGLKRMLIRAFEHTVQYGNLYQQRDADRYADDTQQPVEIERCFFIIEPFEQLAAQGKTDG